MKLFVMTMYLLLAPLVIGIRADDADQEAKGLRDTLGAQMVSIGTAAEPNPIRTDPMYAEILARDFNMLATENAFKMGLMRPTEDSYRFEDTDFLVDFAEMNGMDVRGHTLIWHQQLPDWLSNGTYTREELLTIMEEHVTTVVSRYRGRVDAWDVVNEAVEGDGSLRQSIFLQTIGPEYIEYAFRWAAAADPEARLFYNDFGADGLGVKSEGVYRLMESLLAKRVPVHGIGLQMHTTIGDTPDPEDVRRNMDRLAQLGLEIHVTEMDVRLNDEMGDLDTQLQLQAQTYRSIAEVCIQHPACTAFVTWGFSDSNYARAGRPDTPLLFDANYVPKPAYWALADLFASPVLMQCSGQPCR